MAGVLENLALTDGLKAHCLGAKRKFAIVSQEDQIFVFFLLPQDGGAEMDGIQCLQGRRKRLTGSF